MNFQQKDFGNLSYLNSSQMNSSYVKFFLYASTNLSALHCSPTHPFPQPLSFLITIISLLTPPPSHFFLSLSFDDWSVFVALFQLPFFFKNLLMYFTPNTWLVVFLSLSILIKLASFKGSVSYSYLNSYCSKKIFAEFCKIIPLP